VTGVASLTQVKLLPANLRRCSIPEQTVWGLLAFMAKGDWQRYGVLPPPQISAAPYDAVNLSEVATALGISKERLDELLAGLIEKGTLEWH
jgi:hypothetical protein